MKKFLKPTKITALLVALFVGTLTIGCDTGGGGGGGARGPAAPVFEVVQGSGFGTLVFTWDDDVDGVDAFEIGWTTALTGTPSVPNIVEVTTSPHTLSGLINDSYRVFMRSIGSRIGPWSAAQTASPLISPTNFRATANTANSVTLTWDAIPGAAFNVKYYEGVDIEDAALFTTTPITANTIEVTGLTGSHIFTVWVQAVVDEVEGVWSRATVAVGDFEPNAFDIIVVGAGGAGAAAVIGARSVDFETPQFESPAAGNANWMTNNYWNDLSVLLLEKRHIWGGMTNTAGAGNAWDGDSPGSFGNMSQTLAAGETFEAFRLRNSRHIMSNSAIGATQGVNNAVADNPAHADHIPLGPYYPNWSKAFALYQQMNHINRWIGHRGGVVIGTPGTFGFVAGFGGGFFSPLAGGPTYILLDRIYTSRLADVRLNNKATSLITTGPANDATSVIGVVVQETISSGGSATSGAGSTFTGVTGLPERIAARKVILTSGGFSDLNYREAMEAGLVQGDIGRASAEAFLGQGFVNSYGTGMAMAVEAGAAIMDNFGAITSFGPVLARHLQGLTIGGDFYGDFFVSRPGGFFGASIGPMSRASQIIVGNEGRRFRAENTILAGADAAISDMVVNHWPAWMIFSSFNPAQDISVTGIDDTERGAVLQKVWDYLQTTGPTDIRRIDIARGETLLELAESMGIAFGFRQDFVDEIVAYDAAVREAQGGADWVDPLTDIRPGQGRPAGDGNANLIRFLPGDDPDGEETGVFWAVRVNPTMWDTLGGLATDIWGRVLRNELPRDRGGAALGSFMTTDIVPASASDIILNLYAAGAISNRAFYGYQYQSMSSLGMAPTSAVLSGFHAARSILGRDHSLPTGTWDAAVTN